MTPLIWTLIGVVIVVTALAPYALVMIARRADAAKHKAVQQRRNGE